MYGYARNNPLSFGDEDGLDVIEKVVQSTYVAHGSTANQAMANARQTSGLTDAATGEKLAAETSYSMGVTNEHGSVSVGVGTDATGYPATAELKSADVTLTQTVVMPSWAEHDQASPEEQQNWDNQVSSLGSHEQEHEQINRQGAENLNSSLPRTTGNATGKTPNDAHDKAVAKMQDKVKTKLDSTTQKTNNANNNLDKRTDHGRVSDEKKDKDNP
jgi:predicted secreted Zn-dependent protease